MKEGAFQRQVMDIAKAFGWRVWHVPSPMRSTGDSRGWVGAREAAGLPDLFMLHDDPPRMIVAELKGEAGKLSEAQKEFLGTARSVADISVNDDVNHWMHGGKRTLGVYAWWPKDMRIIEQMLRSKVLL